MVLPCAHALDQLEGEIFSCLSPTAHAAVSLVEGRGSVSFALCAVSATDSTGHGGCIGEGCLQGVLLPMALLLKFVSDQGFPQLLEAAFWPGSQNSLMAFL